MAQKFFAYADYDEHGTRASIGRYTLMTVVPNLLDRHVLKTGEVLSSPRFAVYAVTVPDWMDVLEFEAWANDHYKMAYHGVSSAWGRHVWDQLRKLSGHFDYRLFDAAIYLLTGKLRSATRIQRREELHAWIDARGEADDLFPGIDTRELSALTRSGYYHGYGSDWEYIGESSYGLAVTLEDAYPAIERGAARMARLVAVSNARRVRYAPKPIAVTDDDLAALGDVF